MKSMRSGSWQADMVSAVGSLTSVCIRTILHCVRGVDNSVFTVYTEFSCVCIPTRSTCWHEQLQQQQTEQHSRSAALAHMCFGIIQVTLLDKNSLSCRHVFHCPIGTTLASHIGSGNSCVGYCHGTQMPDADEQVCTHGEHQNVEILMHEDPHSIRVFFLGIFLRFWLILTRLFLGCAVSCLCMCGVTVCACLIHAADGWEWVCSMMAMAWLGERRT